MHLCISGPATALADIPEVNELLAGVLACADKVFAQTAIYFPAPALQQHGPYDNADFPSVHDRTTALKSKVLAPGAATVNCPIVFIEP
jgi:hypothetical protein